MKNVRLIGVRRQSRYVLFSFGGRAVKKTENRKTVYADSGSKDIKSLVSEKIIDYATLQAWYNENKANKAVADSMVAADDDNVETQDMEKKQRNLKFMLL